MSRLIRIVAPVLAAVAIVLGGSSSALAASSNAASAYSWTIDENYCFDDVVLVYCFDIDGKAQFVETSSFGSVVTNERFNTVVYEDGVAIGESTVNSVDRFAIQADGTYTQQAVSHVKSVYGDETCSIQIVWRQAEFETVVDHWSGGCS